MAHKPKLPCNSPFPTAKQDATNVSYDYGNAQSRSSSYRLAYDDAGFMMRDELRPVRLQLELLKPELIQAEHNIQATVVIFGSARIPDYQAAQQVLLNAERELSAQPDDKKLKQNVVDARHTLKKADITKKPDV